MPHYSKLGPSEKGFEQGHVDILGRKRLQKRFHLECTMNGLNEDREEVSSPSVSQDHSAFTSLNDNLKPHLGEGGADSGA